AFPRRDLRPFRKAGYYRRRGRGAHHLGPGSGRSARGDPRSRGARAGRSIALGGRSAGLPTRRGGAAPAAQQRRPPRRSRARRRRRCAAPVAVRGPRPRGSRSLHRLPLMTSDEFRAKYQLINQVTDDDGVRTFHAVASTGAAVMVHFLDGDAAQGDAVRAQLQALAPDARKRVMDTGEVDGTRFLVTGFILDFVSLARWLAENRAADAAPAAGGEAGTPAAAPAAHGAPEPPTAARTPPAPDPTPGAASTPAEPGEFTRLFRAAEATGAAAPETGDPGTGSTRGPDTAAGGDTAPAAGAGAPEHDTPGEFTRLFRAAAPAPPAGKAPPDAPGAGAHPTAPPPGTGPGAAATPTAAGAAPTAGRPAGTQASSGSTGAPSPVGSTPAAPAPGSAPAASGSTSAGTAAGSTGAQAGGVGIAGTPAGPAGPPPAAP